MVESSSRTSSKEGVMKDICILGSGMAGLGAVHRLHEAGLSSRLFDKNDYIGGHTATFAFDDGFIFDDGPHISFTQDKRLQELFASNVGGEYETIHAYVNNYYQGHWIKHPAQCNLHGLPEDLVVTCLRDFVEAQYREAGEIRNYMDWLVASFGATFAKTFPAQYGKKYHTTTSDNMSTVWLGPRLYRPNIEEVLRGALSEQTPHVHYVSHFRYPTYGGFVSYIEPFTRHTEMNLGHEMTELDPVGKTLTFANGLTTTYGAVISSIPLPELLPRIKGAPREVVEAAAQLACTTCATVNIGVDRADLSPANWTYFYDDDYFFTRINMMHKLSPKLVPDGCGSIQCEVYYSDKYRPMTIAPEDNIDPVIRDLKRCGILKDSDRILHTDVRMIKYANVIFDLDREVALPIVHGYLDEISVIYVGRYGDWGYQWTDEAFFSGEKGAQKVIDNPPA
jgi:protoporphyrinogen oxidase